MSSSTEGNLGTILFVLGTAFIILVIFETISDMVRNVWRAVSSTFRRRPPNVNKKRR